MTTITYNNESDQFDTLVNNMIAVLDDIPLRYRKTVVTNILTCVFDSKAILLGNLLTNIFSAQRLQSDYFVEIYVNLENAQTLFNKIKHQSAFIEKFKEFEIDVNDTFFSTNNIISKTSFTNDEFRLDILTVDNNIKPVNNIFPLTYPIKTWTNGTEIYDKLEIPSEARAIKHILNSLNVVFDIKLDEEIFYGSFTIYAMEKLYQYNHSNMYNIEGLRKLIGILYQKSLTSDYVNKIIYGLITLFTTENQLKLLQESFKKINIKLFSDNIGHSHGFNNEEYVFVPQQSEFENEINNININYVIRLIQQTYPSLKINKKEITPEEQLEQARAKMRATAALYASQYGGEDDDDEEEVEQGIYETPSGKEVPARCFQMTQGGNINTSSWSNKEGNILLIVEPVPGLEPDLVCTNVKELEYALRENSGIMYRCGGTRGNRAGSQVMVDDIATLGDVPYDLSMANVDKSVEYIPFVYDVDDRTTVKGYLPKKDMKIILGMAKGNSDLPVVVLKFVDTITHTADKSVMRSGSMLGANHCQAGSSILLFTLERTNDMTIYENAEDDDDDDDESGTEIMSADMEELQDNLACIGLNFQVEWFSVEDDEDDISPIFVSDVNMTNHILEIVEQYTLDTFGPDYQEKIEKVTLYWGNNDIVRNQNINKTFQDILRTGEYTEVILQDLIINTCEVFNNNISEFINPNHIENVNEIRGNRTSIIVMKLFIEFKNYPKEATINVHYYPPTE